ncbi:MAG: hypothetical protein AB1782_16530 [Cyanobacteriota bacterium]
MKVQQLYSNNLISFCSKNKQQQIAGNQNHTTSKVNTTIEYMSIPAKAFIGNISFTKKSNAKEKKTLDYNIFSLNQYKYNKNGPIVKYMAYSQDPLVNNQPEIFSIKGLVSPGPVNTRFKVIDDNSSPATSDTDGNFICDKDSASFDRVNAFVIANNTLNMYEKALGRDIKWAFDENQLILRTRAGEGCCANYHRGEKNIKLFYFPHINNLEETVYTARMADLISHEVGHAIFDSLRPINIGWGKDGRSIHEGFADITAMLLALWNDNLLDSAIKETNGDLKKDNVISLFAEQYGNAKLGTNCLRNMNNKLTMSTFSPGKELKEEHNYGQLLGGTFYEIIVECANKNAKYSSLKKALQQTRNDLTKVFIKAAGDYSPESHVYFSDIALAVLTADKINNNGKYFNEIKNVFIKRELLTPEQINKWVQEQKSLPTLHIHNKNIESEKTIEEFINNNLNNLNLSLNNKYELYNSYTNDYGEVFLSFRALQQFKPGDREYEPDDDLGGVIYSPRTYDILKVAFDSNGKLIFKSTARNKTIEIIYND